MIINSLFVLKVPLNTKQLTLSLQCWYAGVLLCSCVSQQNLAVSSTYCDLDLTIGHTLRDVTDQVMLLQLLVCSLDLLRNFAECCYIFTYSYREEWRYITVRFWGLLMLGPVESNGSLLLASWHRSPAGWLPRTGIGSGTLHSFWVWDYLLLSCSPSLW